MKNILVQIWSNHVLHSFRKIVYNKMFNLSLSFIDIVLVLLNKTQCLNQQALTASSA